MTMATSSKRERIASAVKDPDWVEFRLRLKGTPIQNKLDQLSMYFEYGDHQPGDVYWNFYHGFVNLETCKTCIQVDNYIKALCRGGQLKPGASLSEMLDSNWSNDWIKE